MSVSLKPNWVPIQPLPENWKEWADPELQGLVDEWQSQRLELEGMNAYRTFLERLNRQWAIETGVLERLYSVSPAATKSLIEQGFESALLSSSDTDKEPWEVLAMIKDQHAAIESLYQFVGGERPLGTGYVKELHRLLTQHQESHDAVDTLGRHAQRELRRGDWKHEPNFIEFHGGGRIDFCPPNDVDPEMRNLVDWHNEYASRKIAPEVLAAWLHHRFVQIHPFADGNGRVARCLSTLVFLKQRWFPLVITRDDKPNYIGALRKADGGDLGPLVRVFSELQAKAIREAFGLSEDLVEGEAAISDILGKVTSRWQRERDQERAQLFLLADALHATAAKRLEEIASQITDHIRQGDRRFNATFHCVRRDDPAKAGWYSYQIAKGATQLGYYANRRSYQAWLTVDIYTQNRVEMLFSFHGLGRASGTMACLGVVYSRSSSGGAEATSGDIKLLSNAPFTFTKTQNPNDVTKRFAKWLEDCVIVGLDEWRKLEGA